MADVGVILFIEIATLLEQKIPLLLIGHLQAFLDLTEHVDFFSSFVFFLHLFAFFDSEHLRVNSFPSRINFVLDVPSRGRISWKDYSFSEFLKGVGWGHNSWETGRMDGACLRLELCEILLKETLTIC